MNTTVKVRQRYRYDRSEANRLRGQRGVVLVIALIVVVAMTLASIAMVRSVDTSTVIAGNLAFKQSGVASGDAGVEAAIAWVTANGGILESDSASNGYYATSQKCLDLTGNQKPIPGCSSLLTLDWSNQSTVKTLAKDATGNEAAYVIHRMCDNAGALDGATCATQQSVRGGGSQGSTRQMLTYQPGKWDDVADRAYYRITVRVAGPRNNYSFVQAIVLP